MGMQNNKLLSIAGGLAILFIGICGLLLCLLVREYKYFREQGRMVAAIQEEYRTSLALIKKHDYNAAHAADESDKKKKSF